MTARKGEATNYLYSVVLPYDGNYCLVWPFAKCSKGYGKTNVWENGRRKNIAVARVVCTKTHGEPPTPKHQAAHSCGNGNKGCVSKKHLSWKTRKENSADTILHGRSNRGELQRNVILTEKNVLEIRKMDKGVSKSQIAKMFGVSRNTISNVVNFKTWAWLKQGE